MQHLAGAFGVWIFVVLFGVCADDEFWPYLLILGLTASAAIALRYISAI